MIQTGETIKKAVFTELHDHYAVELGEAEYAVKLGELMGIMEAMLVSSTISLSCQTVFSGSQDADARERRPLQASRRL